MRSDKNFLKYNFDEEFDNNIKDAFLFEEDINCETDNIIKETYINAIKMDSPDLWGRISDGVNVEIQKKKKTKIVIRYLASAAAMLICIVAYKYISSVGIGETKDSKEINDSQSDIIEMTKDNEYFEFSEAAVEGGNSIEEASSDSLSSDSAENFQEESAQFSWESKEYSTDNNLVVDGYVIKIGEEYYIKDYEILSSDSFINKELEIKLNLPDDIDISYINDNMHGRYCINNIIINDEKVEGLLTKIN